MVKVLVFGLTLRQAMGTHEIELDVAGTTTIKKMIEKRLSDGQQEGRPKW